MHMPYQMNIDGFSNFSANIRGIWEEGDMVEEEVRGAGHISKFQCSNNSRIITSSQIKVNSRITTRANTCLLILQCSLILSYAVIPDHFQATLSNISSTIRTHSRPAGGSHQIREIPPSTAGATVPTPTTDTSA